MHADIDGATRIVRLAAEFDWTWNPDDIPRFCETAGWEILSNDEGTFEIRTNLQIQRPDSSAYTRSHKVEYITFPITNSNSQGSPFAESHEQALEILLDVSTTLSAFLGEPTSMFPAPDAKVQWHTSKLIVEAVELGDFALIRLKSPEYQAWLDEP
ncbi:DUF6301 family protein [Nocardia sp. NPDC020380]|uniref:DUF6301 family protein n=1 Tax=Nocardia sp. NPDC020380 TaxID=3364309 RepID=UPI0037B6E61C